MVFPKPAIPFVTRWVGCHAGPAMEKAQDPPTRMEHKTDKECGGDVFHHINKVS